MKEFGVALVGGLVAAVVGVVAQYCISYKLIEEPKIQLEIQKVALEAQKQSAVFMPIFKHDCSASVVDYLTWRVFCENKSESQYPVQVGIRDVNLVLKDSPNSGVYREDSGYKITYPDQRREYLAFPSSSGFIEFYINLDRKKFPNGVGRQDLIARVSFVFSTSDAVIKPYLKAFPEMQESIKKIATSPLNYFVNLPPTISVVQPTASMAK